MRSGGRSTFLVAVVAAGTVAFAAAAAERPSLTAGSTSAPVRVDGVLDEPAWRTAGVIPELVQQAPTPLAPTPFRTEVRVLVNHDTLFIAFVCGDPDPAAVAVHTMQRDGGMGGDDNVAVVLDTFDDRKTGYVFRVNAAGARWDGLINGAEHPNGDWDGIWDAAARRTPSGWTVEMAIPALTLRFAAGRDRWGFNVERTVARDRVDLRWAALSLDASLYDLQRVGELRGVAGLRQGVGVSVSPYALLRGERDRRNDASALAGDGGVDFSYALSSELTGALTANTDFAETEVDARQVNLTRFSLFFPEKRAFFLEGANQFEFGTGLGRAFIPFFSRRMGLYEGGQVPIVAGAKVIGRTGRFGIGVVDVVTDDATVVDEDEGTVYDVRASNLFAGRLTYDVDEHLRLGVIATDGAPDGVSTNRLVGVDANWQTSTFRGDKNLAAGIWYARSSGDVDAEEVSKGQRHGWGFRVDYPNDLWDVSVTYKELGDALVPGLGFLPRPGTRRTNFNVSYMPRPRRGWWASWIRQFFFESRLEFVEGLDARTQSWRYFTAPFNAETSSGEHLEVNWAPQFERLDEPFEIADGVVIPVGDYRFDRFRAEVGTARYRSWRVATSVWFGDFYTGTLTQWEQSLAYTTSGGHLQLELHAENAFGSLPQGSFVERLYRLRTTWAFTPDLYLSVFTQYDSESRELGVNSRLRWTLRPGTDVFVVWNRGWERPVQDRRWPSFAPTDDQLVVKLRYTWRR